MSLITYNLFIIIAAVNLIVFLIYYNWKRRYLYLAAWKLNGPPALPIIGNGHMFICKNEEILMKIHKFANDGHCVDPKRFWLGPMLLIAFRSPDHVEKILSSPKFAQKHDIYKFGKIYLGDGLVSSSGPMHKQHRKIIQPMFNVNFVKESVGVIQKHVDFCMNSLVKYVDKGNFDFHDVVHKCMIDIIKEIVLGSNERSQLNGSSEFDQAMIDFYDSAFTRSVRPYLHHDFIFNLTPYKKIQDRLQRTMRKQAQTYFEASFKRRRLQNITKDFHPIIDQLMDCVEDHPEIMTDNTFLDHILTLFTAAEDTLGIISGFLSMCFGMYPEYQKKAANEIRNIIGDTPRSVTYDDVTKMDYLSMCLQEAYRLFPIAPVILRQCTDDIQLDKWYIPKGCGILVPIFTIHRNKMYWDNPDDFYPNHFLPEVVNKRHPFAYIPFSAGSRSCIGKFLANTTLKIFFCNLLQRFELEADGKVPDLELKMDASTRPKRGYSLRLKERVWK